MFAGRRASIPVPVMNPGTLTEPAGVPDAAFEPSTDGGRATVQDDEPTLTTDTLFELLKNRRRRDAIDFLKANDGETTLSDLAEHIAAAENDLPVEEISSKQRKRVYISLYQCHLPKMDRAGVVDFDKNRGSIRLDERASQLYPYLDATDAEAEEGSAVATTLDEKGLPTQRGVGAQSSALAGVGIAGLAGVAGVPGFDLLSPVIWTVVCACCLLAVAVLPVVSGTERS